MLIFLMIVSIKQQFGSFFCFLVNQRRIEHQPLFLSDIAIATIIAVASRGDDGPAERY